MPFLIIGYVSHLNNYFYIGSVVKGNRVKGLAYSFTSAKRSQPRVLTTKSY